MLAADGRCKALDAAADGYGRAEACAAFLLAAVETGAEGAPALHSPAIVVNSSAVNQDGRSSGLTAPNGPSQQAAIWAALQTGSMDAGSVYTLELHGTGTALGDPIEVGAALAVLQHAGSAHSQQPLTLTSAKSRLGHAETGAGVLGMLHAWRQLQQAASCGITHLRGINPHVAGCIDGDGSGAAACHLPRLAAPAAQLDSEPCAGISSFAFQVRLRLGCFHLCVLPAIAGSCFKRPTKFSLSSFTPLCRAPTHTCCCVGWQLTNLACGPSQRCCPGSARGRGWPRHPTRC